MLRLQCDICGEKSGAVASLPPSALEAAMLAEFRRAHDATCARHDRVNFPAGATSVEPPAEVLARAQVGPFGRPKPPPRSAPRPHGHFEYTGPYGERLLGDTLQCCHCQKHWEVRAGSGRTRGWCYRCAASTCGHPACDECVPREQRIENLAAGRPERAPRAPQAPVPGLPAALARGAVLLGAGDGRPPESH